MNNDGKELEESSESVIPEVINSITDEPMMSNDDWREVMHLVQNHGYSTGADFLLRKRKQKEQVISVGYSFKAFAHEGAYAIFQAVTEIYGRLEMNTTHGMSGSKPPKLINIALPNGDYIKVPWGQVRLPSFDDDESVLEMSWDEDDNTFYVQGQVKRKFEPEVERIAKMVQYKLDNESIYNGQALLMDLGGKSGRVRYNEPKFLDLGNVDPDNVIISQSTRTELNPIIQRITKSEICKENGLDLKYGALLEGPYGTGKTLIAFMLAKLAVENNWTFIYLEDCRDMGRALRVAEKYTRGDQKGCVIFTEDIDQVVKGERGAQMQEILNTLDGGDTKGKPIISIFTTNHLELIDPTFLRGKRIGGIISMGALDEQTALMFLKQIAVNKEGVSLMEEEHWEKASKALCGIVPAFAHEVIDASKIFMIARGDTKISDEDIAAAAEGYKRQIEVAQCRAKDPEQHKLANALELVGDGLEGRLGNDD